MKKIYYSLIPILLFASCKEKRTEFVYISKRHSTYTVEGKNYETEVVFIINPPTDATTCIKLIEAYNDSTVNKSKIESSFDHFERAFYRESANTPRDFEDDLSFITDLLADHRKDHIASFQMKKCVELISNNQERKTGKTEWKLECYDGNVFSFNTIYYGGTCF
jgi:hypothetical protein